MTGGVVNGRNEAIVRLRVRGPSGTEIDIDAVVDTGLSAALTLSQRDIAHLGLSRVSASYAVLADGSWTQFDVFAAELLWDAVWQPVLISGMDSEALIGMGLLAGHSLRIDVTPGGMVGIAQLP
jgi:predicted aspartyl protease